MPVEIDIHDVPYKPPDVHEAQIEEHEHDEHARK